MIRPAEASDHPAMNDVFQAAARAFCTEAYGAELVEAWAGNPRPDKYLRGENGGTDFYVLIRQGRVVGYGGLNLKKQLLEALFVDPSLSGQGVGHEMSTFLFATAEAAGIDRLRLESSLNAASFYQRQGFVEVAR